MLGYAVLTILAAAIETADVTWRPDAALAAEFLPARGWRGAFELAVTDAPLRACLDDERRSWPSPDAQSWTIERVAPTDAFGTIGGYDRMALAKLFGSRRVEVVRAPRRVGGAVVASVTLLSPYPDSTMSRLLPGTLRIITHLPR